MSGIEPFLRLLLSFEGGAQNSDYPAIRFTIMFLKGKHRPVF